MPTVSVVTATWSGFSGAPGYTRFSFFELTSATVAQTAVNAVRGFFQGINLHLMTTWSIQVSPVVQHRDIATGVLTGEVTAGTTPSAVVGTVASTNNFAGGSGYVLDWTTGQFFSGRKVRGRTFIVPAVNVYSPDGTVAGAVIIAATAAGNNLISTAGVTLGIYCRKFDGASPPNQTAGNLSAVNGCTVPDRAAQLRSRRS